MRHWTKLGEAPIPGTEKTLLLYRGKDDFSIRISGGFELMNTRKHASEDALGRLPCKRLKQTEAARVLIGGLGMGFTLAAVLEEVGAGAQVVFDGPASTSEDLFPAIGFVSVEARLHKFS